ncbi:Transcriptional regulatory protein LevR, contains PRD, AAA+ and EIIA domains [Fictibacillus solisalsi]|uniref:Transcriptional regulatory protein LevR, contains PRD, AAA+ and EIIA domains n=1 Tax=Fictibacillus solisalsi TaxID=459525 RepID=A0A1H0BKH2_9BACL|nr:sigma 54-interacting transcriptional regulator [Fictibacillus solisalsi]SDN46166.1 Transcriptional regulatory protein LevR, contains PRD, AAA+ and EIIA domains [Fictibacillus solisalsi]
MGLIKLITKTFIEKIQQISEERTTASQLEDGIEARSLAEELNLSRSVASRYLNEMNRSGILIKVNSRPVYFFSKKMVEQQYQVSIDQLVYNTFEEMLNHIRPLDTTLDDPFVHLIGHAGSLKKPIEQCKVAISYPPKGLPFLIVGETGVGKSYMAKLIYEYAKNKGVIPKKAPFITLNCAEFANNPELLTANLFGSTKGAFTGAHKDTTGIIQEADGGVLFLDEVHRLNAEGQEKLFLFMDKGIYHPLGGSDNWKKATVRMVFATTEDPEETFLQTFLRRIPITLTIPSLKERTENEKYSLICNFYKTESKNVNVTFELKKGVIEALMNANIRGNVGELKNIITYSCAKAYTEVIHTKSDEKIEISLKDLPGEIVKDYIINHKSSRNINPFYQRTLIVDPLKEMDSDFNQRGTNSNLLDLYKRLLHLFHECQREQEKFNIGIFIKKATVPINQYLDKLIFNKQSYKDNLEFITVKHFMESIIESTDFILKPKLSGNSVIALTHFILHSGNNNGLTENDLQSYKEFQHVLKRHLQKEIDFAEMIIDETENTFGISMDPMDLFTLAIYVKGLSSSLDSKRIKAVIIAHGYSTASSIANLSNRLLREDVFEAFDMPFEVSTSEILIRLTQYLKSINTSKGVIILVDMGSLVEIKDRLNDISPATIGILNNITTQIAIDTGEKIIKGLSVKDILREVAETYKPSYQLVEPVQQYKKNAIITTCITGIGTAVKIKGLLDKGINSNIDDEIVQVLPYDFLSLKVNGLNDAVFKEYNVLGIIGTADPGVLDTTFVGIEDIISGKDNEAFCSILGQVLPSEGIETITNNIVKLFSLQNVINHLTILNPDMIIEHVSEVVSDLQNQFTMKFSNQTRISLYIHLSCLIERLVKKSPIDDYGDIEDFMDKQKDFIQTVKEIFRGIEETYGIEIPISEIGYIYDIIKIRYSEEKVENGEIIHG